GACVPRTLRSLRSKYCPIEGGHVVVKTGTGHQVIGFRIISTLAPGAGDWTAFDALSRDTVGSGAFDTVEPSSFWNVRSFSDVDDTLIVGIPAFHPCAADLGG